MGVGRVRWEGWFGTVESFFVELVDAFSLIDAILILFCGVADHSDLILFVDEVAVKYYMSVGVLELGRT